MAEAQLQIERYWAGALRRAAIDGDIENGSLMAGQSVGMVTSEEPAAEILAALLSQSEAALSRRYTRAGRPSNPEEPPTPSPDVGPFRVFHLDDAPGCMGRQAAEPNARSLAFSLH